MKVYFPNEMKEYKNTSESIKEIIEKINQYVKESDQISSHLQVNDTDIYENHYSYLLNELLMIKEVRVILKSKQEVTADLQQSLNDYLARALPSMEQLSVQFYQGESESAWNNFTDLVDGLQWIISALQALGQYAEEEASLYYKEVSGKLESVLQELVDALEAKDTVTIADIIQYEILETLADVQQNVHH